MKTAVDKVRPRQGSDVNARFGTMVSHFLFEAEFCNPASGWEKGQVEKNVRDAHRLWQHVPAFATLAASTTGWRRVARPCGAEIDHGKLPGTIAGRLDAGAGTADAAAAPFDGFVEHTKRVSPTCLVTFERVRYSVPASFANRPVSLRVYAERIVVAAEGQLLCEHRRVIDRRHDSVGHTVYDWRHYPRCCNASQVRCATAPRSSNCQQPSGSCGRLCSKQPGGDREMVEVLAWCCTTTSRRC